MVLLNSGVNIYGYEYTNVYCFKYFFIKFSVRLLVTGWLNTAFFPYGAKFNSISCNEYVLDLGPL